jgi:hypothetical protein
MEQSSKPIIIAAAIAAFATVVAALIATRGSGNSQVAAPEPGQSSGTATSPLNTPSSRSASDSSPPVLYRGTRDLSATFAADLDNPTWAVAPVGGEPAGGDIYFDGSGNLSRYNGEWGIVRGSPVDNGYQLCAGFTAFQASLVPVSGLGVGTRLCVRTSEARVGLLIVRGISGQAFSAVMSFDVTLWDSK